MEWVLISGIFSGLDVLVEQHGWNMSIGENACCAEIFYKYLIKGIPESIKDVHAMFEEAYVYTWGEDHECDKTSKEEIKDFFFALSDYYKKESSSKDYIQRIQHLL